MKYYVAWVDSDPVFQEYLPSVGVLVSPPSVTHAWHTKQWPTAPLSLILDSGGYQNRRRRLSLTPDEVLKRQLHILADYPGSVGICHFDVPPVGKQGVSARDRHLAQNLAHAEWLLLQAKQLSLPENAYLIGVIQGYDIETVFFSGLALADLGYQHFALGSLAGMVASSRERLLRRVEAALEAVGPNLHILGVSSPPLLAELVRLGIRSADSSAPMHEAWRGGLFYSRPFRRFKIPSPHFKEWQRSYSFAEVLPAPLPCECPVCQTDTSMLMQPLGRQAIHRRAIHNCYHLMREFDEMQT